MPLRWVVVVVRVPLNTPRRSASIVGPDTDLLPSAEPSARLLSPPALLLRPPSVDAAAVRDAERRAAESRLRRARRAGGTTAAALPLLCSLSELPARTTPRGCWRRALKDTSIVPRCIKP